MFHHTKTEDAAEKQLLKDKCKTARTTLDNGKKCLEALTNELDGVNLYNL